MWLMHVSLLHGWLPPTLGVGALGSLALGVAWLRRAIWQWLAVAAGAGAAVALLAWKLDITRQVGSTYPRSFLVWAALPVFAIGAATVQWRAVGWIRRAVTIAAVPLLVAFAGLLINDHYAYLPTVGDLVGAPLPGQVAPQQLEHVAGARTMRNWPRVGEVARLDIPATVSGFPHRDAFVFVPPAYFASPRPDLPVLMLLSGTPGAPGDWLRGGRALAVSDGWAAAHGGRAPMLVLPDANGSLLGDTECVNGPRGRAETYLTVDVVAFMRRHFGASADPRQWAVAGLSEGGTCALELAARHPEVFATFGDFGGDPAPTLDSPVRTLRLLYGGSRADELAHDPTTWFRKDAIDGVQGVFAVGRNDRGFLRVDEQVATIAAHDGMHVRFDVIAGGHTFHTWARALADAYPWIVSRLDAAPSRPVQLTHTCRPEGPPCRSPGIPRRGDSSDESSRGVSRQG
jgi:S-formylglutathione hydrolase FrmB